MGYRIDSGQTRYIQVTVDGVLDRETALAELNDVLTRPDYPDRHTLWDFTGANMGLNIQDIEEITGVLRLYRPAGPGFANRVALVVSGRMELAMANIFIAAAKLLPFKYKAFLDLNAARTFASSSSTTR